MEVKVYFDNQNVKAFKPTFLNYADGFVLEADELDIENLEENGVRYIRRAHMANSEAMSKIAETVLVAPEEIGHVRYVVVDGETMLHADGFGGLVNPAFLQDVEDEDLEDVSAEPLAKVDAVRAAAGDAAGSDIDGLLAALDENAAAGVALSQDAEYEAFFAELPEELPDEDDGLPSAADDDAGGDVLDAVLDDEDDEFGGAQSYDDPDDLF